MIVFVRSFDRKRQASGITSACGTLFGSRSWPCRMCVSAIPLYICLTVTENAALESWKFPLGVSVRCWCSCWTESCIFVQGFF
jgi:hypothetical protein